MIYWYPLTKEERDKIRKGAIITKHYHDALVTEKITLMVFCGKTKVPEEKCKGYLKVGINITSIVLIDADLDKLDNKDGIFAQYPSFEVGVISQEAFDELTKQKEAA
jgi:hypothetical protein